MTAAGSAPTAAPAATAKTLLPVTVHASTAPASAPVSPARTTKGASRSNWAAGSVSKPQPVHDSEMRLRKPSSTTKGPPMSTERWLGGFLLEPGTSAWMRVTTRSTPTTRIGHVDTAQFATSAQHSRWTEHHHIHELRQLFEVRPQAAVRRAPLQRQGHIGAMRMISRPRTSTPIPGSPPPVPWPPPPPPPTQRRCRARGGGCGDAACPVVFRLGGEVRRGQPHPSKKSIADWVGHGAVSTRARSADGPQPVSPSRSTLALRGVHRGIGLGQCGGKTT